MLPSPSPRTLAPPPPTARVRLLQAAVQRVRDQGFVATRVDQLCSDAGVSKGAFVLAKTCGADQAAAMAREALGHLRRYVELLLDGPRTPGARRRPARRLAARPLKETTP